jgi:hypothetical protein
MLMGILVYVWFPRLVVTPGVGGLLLPELVTFGY